MTVKQCYTNFSSPIFIFICYIQKQLSSLLEENASLKQDVEESKYEEIHKENDALKKQIKQLQSSLDAAGVNYN